MTQDVSPSVGRPIEDVAMMPLADIFHKRRKQRCVQIPAVPIDLDDVVGISKWSKVLSDFYGSPAADAFSKVPKTFGNLLSKD